MAQEITLENLFDENALCSENLQQENAKHFVMRTVKVIGRLKRVDRVSPQSTPKVGWNAMDTYIFCSHTGQKP